MESDDQALTSDDEPDPALSDGCPMWIEAVEMRAQSDRDQSWLPENVLATDLSSFRDEPELLYLALDFAARRGVPVVMLPY